MACKARLALLVMLLTLSLFQALAAPEALPLSNGDFDFLLGVESFPLDAPAAPLLAAVKKAGIALEMAEAESCLFDGKDREYIGEELLVGTQPRGPKGGEMMETIMALGGDWLTVRGIGIGDPREKVLAAYGEPDLQDADMMVYLLDGEQDGPMLAFFLDLEQDTVLSWYITMNTQG